MGIRGLTSFILEHPELMLDHELHDTRVIIDGNNLLFFLYFHHRIPFQFGGDYDIFYQKAQSFFSVLACCNISPFIVFDGAYEKDDRKLATIMYRFKRRIDTAHAVSQCGHGSVLPILVLDTFRCLLNDIHIPHVMCDLEADNQIAALAIEWECPVLSNDSDFFVFDIGNGCVPLDHINFEVKTDSNDKDCKYLSTKIYHLKNFVQVLKGFGVTDLSFLPLLGTLLGNDYIDVKYFENFFGCISKSEVKNTKAFTAKNPSRIICILSWYRSRKNVAAAIEEIVNMFKLKERENARQIIKMSMNIYSTVDSSFSLSDFFQQGMTNAPSAVHSYSGHNLLSWFTSSCRKCDLPAFILNAISTHRVTLMCQVENISKLSSYFCSQSIRQIVYGLLLSEERSVNVEGKMSKRTHIEEIDRDIKNIKTTLVEPRTKLSQTIDLPSLSVIPELNHDQRRDLLVIAMDMQLSDLLLFQEDLRLLTSAVIVWLKKAEPRVSENHLKSLIVSLLWIRLKHDERTLHAAASTECCLTLDDAIASTNKDQLYLCKSNLRKYSTPPTENHKSPRDLSVIHGFAQLQTCILSTIHLNKVLLCPFQTPNPAMIFNGTFLYNFCRELDVRRNPDLFIQEMLVRQSPIINVYSVYLKSILDIVVSRDTFSNSVIRSKKKTKKKSTKHENLHLGQSDEDSRADKSNSKNAKMVTTANCEIVNRFAALDMDSD